MAQEHKRVAVNATVVSSIPTRGMNSFNFLALVTTYRMDHGLIKIETMSHVERNKKQRLARDVVIFSFV